MQTALSRQKTTLRGLADPRLAAAIRCMHEHPGHAWTVAMLAREAALSRSTFFDRFRRAVGTAPMDYLLTWRMALAQSRLRRGQGGITEVAKRVGYGSASTFSVAFARHVGVPPGRYADSQARASAESARGISPRAAHRTGLEPLDSSGSCHSPKTAAFRLDPWAHPVSRWPIDPGASDPPPSLHLHYRDFVTTTEQSDHACRIGTFSLTASAACTFSLGIDRQVLKFRALAKMRVTPPSHRTLREQ